MREIKNLDGTTTFVADPDEIAEAERKAYGWRAEPFNEYAALKAAGQLTDEHRMRRLREQQARGAGLGYRTQAQLNHVDVSKVRLGELAALLLKANGDWLGGVEAAKAMQHAALEVLARGAVNAGSLADLPAAKPLTQAFVAELSAWGVFDKLLADMRPLSLTDRSALIIEASTAYIVGEGQAKPLSPITLSDGTDSVPIKAVATVVATKEFLSLGFDEAAAKLESTLVRAVSKATDAAFLADLFDSGATTTTTGSVLADIAALLALVRRHAGERFALVMGPTLAGQIATLETADGSARFPTMSPSGGTLANLPALVTDGITSGTLALIDATGIAGASGAVELERAEHATVEMSDEPGSGSLTSLWQSNLIALRAERYFSAALLRDDAVAAIEDADYAAS